MVRVSEICGYLEQLAPCRLAEEWDNVGLLVGQREQEVSRIMTCLTVTPQSAAEAVQRRVDLIVTHHPLPFRPLARLTDETTVGRLLLTLIRAGIAVYSAHTAFDSARDGINQQLAAGLELQQIQPLLPLDDDQRDIGGGRWGRLLDPQPLQVVVDRLKQFLQIPQLQYVGLLEQPVETIAVACGSAGSFLAPARQSGCQVLVTGETNFHTSLEAQATGVALLLTGHYASERFAMEQLARQLQAAFAQLEVWPSEQERDPLLWT